jgi:Leucine-rich repeat (LRR) protein
MKLKDINQYITEKKSEDDAAIIKLIHRLKGRNKEQDIALATKMLGDRVESFIAQHYGVVFNSLYPRLPLNMLSVEMFVGSTEIHLMRRLTEFPEILCSLEALRKLNMEQNDLSTLPDCIGNLTELEELILDNNEIKAIPDSIGNLINLKKLYLNYNTLSTLPKTIGKLINLETLAVAENNNIVLPIAEIAKLKKLTFVMAHGAPQSTIKQLKEVLPKDCEFTY